MVTCDYQEEISTDLMVSYSGRERVQIIKTLAPFLKSYKALKEAVQDYEYGDRALQENYLAIDEFILGLLPDICEAIIHPDNKPWALIVSRLMEKQTDKSFTILLGVSPSFLSARSLEELARVCSANICQNQPEMMQNAVVASLTNVADRMRQYIDPSV